MIHNKIIQLHIITHNPSIVWGSIFGGSTFRRRTLIAWFYCYTIFCAPRETPSILFKLDNLERETVIHSKPDFGGDFLLKIPHYFFIVHRLFKAMRSQWYDFINFWGQFSQCPSRTLPVPPLFPRSAKLGQPRSVGEVLNQKDLLLLGMGQYLGRPCHLGNGWVAIHHNQPNFALKTRLPGDHPTGTTSMAKSGSHISACPSSIIGSYHFISFLWLGKVILVPTNNTEIHHNSSFSGLFWHHP